MAVLPAASSQALPPSYRKLMTDPLSPILDFYPEDFVVDRNGKKHSWQGVVKLPFIDESRLLSEIGKAEHTLTDEEKRRNSSSLDVLFAHSSHPLAAKIFSFCKRNKNNPKLPLAKVKRKIDPAISGGMNGYMYISSLPVRPVDILSPIDGMELISKNCIVSVFYKPPAHHPHITKVPKGVVRIKKLVTKKHIKPPPVLWHEQTAIVQRSHTQRCLPKKSVSGPHLAKLAHELVLRNCPSKALHDANGGSGQVGKRKSDQPDSHHKKKRRQRNKNNLSVAENGIIPSATALQLPLQKSTSEVQHNANGDSGPALQLPLQKSTSEVQHNADGDSGPALQLPLQKSTSEVQHNANGDWCSSSDAVAEIYIRGAA